MGVERNELAEKIMDIDNEVWDEFGISSRPTGQVRLDYITLMCERLKAANIDHKSVSLAYDALEDENYHSANEALEVYSGIKTLGDVEQHEREWCESLNLDFDTGASRGEKWRVGYHGSNY